MTVPNNANTYLPQTPVTPLALLITNITQSYPMVITAQIPDLFILPANPNTYIAGQVIRLNIPESYGMTQANGLSGKILSVNGLVFTVNIDSRYFDPFSLPITGEQLATFAPAGSSNLQFNNSTDLVPFQSGTNTGN